ncbi:hypothetical protein WDU94_011209 [Cyamophila willieti]
MITIQACHRFSTMPENHFHYQTCSTSRIKPIPFSEFFSCGCCAKKNRFCEFVLSKTCFFILTLIALIALLTLLNLLRRAREESCNTPEIKEEKDQCESDARNTYKTPIVTKDHKEECKENKAVDKLASPPVVCTSHKTDDRSNCLKRRAKCKTIHKKEECTRDLRKYHQLCEILCKDQKDSDEYLFKEGNIVPLNPLEINYFPLSEDLKKYLDDIEVKTDNIDLKCSSEESLSVENLSKSCLEQDSKTLLKENICKIEKGLRNLTAKVDTLVKCGDGNIPATDNVKNDSKTKLVMKIELLEETIKQMENKLKSVEEETKNNVLPDNLNNDIEKFGESSEEKTKQLEDKHSQTEPKYELKSDEILKKELEETIENIGKEMLEMNQKYKNQRGQYHTREESKKDMIPKEQVEDLMRDLRTMLEKYFPDKSTINIRAPDEREEFDAENYKENIEKISKLSQQLEMCLKERQNLQAQLDKDKTNERNINQNKPNDGDIKHNIVKGNMASQTSEFMGKELGKDKIENSQKNETSIENSKKDSDEKLENRINNKDNIDTNFLNELLDGEMNENFEKIISETKNKAGKEDSNTKHGQTLETDSPKIDLNTENDNKNEDISDETKTEVRRSDPLREELDREIMKNLEHDAIDGSKTHVPDNDGINTTIKKDPLDKDLEKDMMDNLDNILVKGEKNDGINTETKNDLLDKDLETDIMNNLDNILVKGEKSDTLEEDLETELMEKLGGNASTDEKDNKKAQQELSTTFIQELREDLNSFLNKHFEPEPELEANKDISFTSMDELALDLMEDIEAKLGLETEDSKGKTPTERKKNWLSRKMPNIGKLFPKPTRGTNKKKFVHYPW